MKVVLAAILFNGLLYPEMGTIAAKMQNRGQHVATYWHDQEPVAACPSFILGHSMGGPAALSQGRVCAAKHQRPKVIVTIDPMGVAGTYSCPSGVKCINYYDPSHVLGPGNAARAVQGATNIIVRGYTHLQIPSAPVVVKGALAATQGK